MLAVIAVIIIFFVIVSYVDKKSKREAKKAWVENIYKKYGHTETAEKIINKTVWVGETTEQLTDSLGSPVDIDESVLKTKKKEVWKYYRKSANRYGFKVKVENGVVVGWDEKM